MTNQIKQRTAEREEKIRRVLGYRQKGLTVVLSNIHDPHNVSAIYRSCDAFGVPEVHLYYTDTAFPKLGARSSASARKWVDTVRHTTADSLIASLKKENMQILATNCSPQAKPLADYRLDIPTAFILGNEHRGVDENLYGLVDGEVYIPMYGMIQSFNVSVAAAVLLAEASRQRLAAGLYDRCLYTEEELENRLGDWLEK